MWTWKENIIRFPHSPVDLEMRKSKISSGLPIPWLIWISINSRPIAIHTNDPVVPVLVLLLMLLCTIGIIVFGNWVLTKKMGMFML